MHSAVGAFVEAINRHDVATLSTLMTDDHRFIDSLGNEMGGGPDGRAIMTHGCWMYFDMVPDYRIDIELDSGRNETVILLGHAGGTLRRGGNLLPENAWRVPAAWRAVVRGNSIALWQVYADNKRMHEMLAGA